MVVIELLFRRLKLDELPYCVMCYEVKTKNTFCKKCREELNDIETNMSMRYMDIERRATKNKQFDPEKAEGIIKRVQERMGKNEQKGKKATET